MSYYSLNLDELRSQEHGRVRKTPFEHQLDAFEALNRTFTFTESIGKGGLLVLPTGGGKTFTAVKWLCDHAIKRGIKVLWLAHSFYLLHQAFREFHDYACWIPEPKQTLNIRVVSSNPSDDSPSSIELTDDVVIMTTQTAIKNLHLDATDRYGARIISNFRRFVEDGDRTGLVVVLDEAHHAPAHGCRRLLVSEEESMPGIRRLAPRTNLLGLTATPTYTDKARRGWLGKIFEAGIIHEARKADLTAQGILAKPEYIHRPTGKELIVSDDLYNRLVREHKDLPEDIVEKLATDSPRNDYIVQEYIRKKDLYGKTIIFADRWHQCVYLKTKLKEKGIKADAVYSHIDADPGSAEGRNQRTASENERILDEFRNGKDASGRDTLDVLINVRMLTEGADFPSVRTVFLTRQTTSAILMAQMIGRALRGKRVGGEEKANIVLFMDEWKRFIDWAAPISLEGGTEEEQVIRGHRPLEYISIRLVEELSRQINSGGEILAPSFSSIVPVGWFQTETVVGSSENGLDETQAFVEFVMVYEHMKEQYDAFIKDFLGHIPEGWDREFLPPEWMSAQVKSWMSKFFGSEDERIGNELEMDLTRIARHIAQSQTAPPFYSFEERSKYDLDSIAKARLNKTALENDEFLRGEFSKPGNLWNVFYKSQARFSTAFNGAMQRVLYERRHGTVTSPPPIPGKRRLRELTDAEKEQVKRRDEYTCRCCGAKRKDRRLEIDHITPYIVGGETTIENSQTLCIVCNQEKNIHDLNFLQIVTPLQAPGELALLPRAGTEDVKQSLTRLINYFYRCHAVREIRINERSNGRLYSVRATWEIELFAGNDPKWLNQYKRQVLAHIQSKFRCPHVWTIKITDTK